MAVDVHKIIWLENVEHSHFLLVSEGQCQDIKSLAFDRSVFVWVPVKMFCVCQNGRGKSVLFQDDGPASDIVHYQLILVKNRDFLLKKAIRWAVK